MIDISIRCDECGDFVDSQEDVDSNNHWFSEEHHLCDHCQIKADKKAKYPWWMTDGRKNILASVLHGMRVNGKLWGTNGYWAYQRKFLSLEKKLAVLYSEEMLTAEEREELEKFDNSELIKALSKLATPTGDEKEIFPQNARVVAGSDEFEIFGTEGLSVQINTEHLNPIIGKIRQFKFYYGDRVSGSPMLVKLRATDEVVGIIISRKMFV